MTRDKVGKNSGQGMSLKLGMNSTYGKMAQSVGSAPFQNWIYAGLITAGTRAQCLRLMGLTGEQNMLAIATDGAIIRKDISKAKLAKLTPKTGAEKAEKPLGAWDADESGPIFLLRPGVYTGFKVRARGINRKILVENEVLAKKGFAYWMKRDPNHEEARITFPDVTRFTGINQGIYKVGEGEETEYRRSELYGKWNVRPQILHLDPKPKREKILRDGTLTLRRFPDVVSLPYDRAVLSPEKQAFLQDTEMWLDQPDLDEGDDFEDSFEGE
jgi:hypothetical protein